MDVYERMERACETVSRLELAKGMPGGQGNSGALLEFLRNNRLSATTRLSPGEIDRQILEEREGWE